MGQRSADITAPRQSAEPPGLVRAETARMTMPAARYKARAAPPHRANNESNPSAKPTTSSILRCHTNGTTRSGPAGKWVSAVRVRCTSARTYESSAATPVRCRSVGAAANTATVVKSRTRCRVGAISRMCAPWVNQGVRPEVAAGSPRHMPRRIRPAPALPATTSSRGCGDERGRSEVHTEPPAPDRYRPVPAQVEAGRHVVVLVADVALQGAEINEPGQLRGGLILHVVGRHEVHTDVGAVGGRELGQAQHEASIRKAKDRRRSSGLVSVLMKSAGRDQ